MNFKLNLLSTSTKFLGCITLLTTTSYADTPNPISCTQTRPSLVYTGGSYSYVTFAPKDSPSFHGNLGGAQISYEYRPKNSIYEGLEFHWRQGTMQGSNETRELLDFDTQARIGYTVATCCDKFLITPFTGFGWRYLGHKLKQPAESTLNLDYNEVYIPVGLLADFKIMHSFFLGLHTTWMPQVFPTVNLKPIGNTRWVLENTLANILVELPMTYRFKQKKVSWSLNLKPFFEYWNDGKTLAKTTSGIALDLPSNMYKFWGTELNIGCSF